VPAQQTQDIRLCHSRVCQLAGALAGSAKPREPCSQACLCSKPKDIRHCQIVMLTGYCFNGQRKPLGEAVCYGVPLTPGHANPLIASHTMACSQRSHQCHTSSTECSRYTGSRHTVHMLQQHQPAGCAAHQLVELLAPFLIHSQARVCHFEHKKTQLHVQLSTTCLCYVSTAYRPNPLPHLNCTNVHGSKKNASLLPYCCKMLLTNSCDCSLLSQVHS
jgi:hypothetical protein